MKIRNKRELDFVLDTKLYKERPEMVKAIREPKFTIKLVGVTHRWITHWDKEGLLFNDYEAEKWRRFNLIEYVWLKMIVQMRQFNLSLSTIKKVKEVLSQTAKHEDDDIVKSTRAVAKAYLQGKYTDQEIDSALEEFMTSDQFEKLMVASRITALEVSIIDSLLLKNHFSFLINVDGDCIPFKEKYIDEYYKDSGFTNFIRRSYISISLSQILADFIDSNDLEIVHGELCLIDNEEKELIKAVRDDGVKSVKVRINKDREIDLLEISKTEKVDKASRLIELIMNEGYQDITIKTQEGNIVFCENTRKIKL